MFVAKQDRGGTISNEATIAIDDISFLPGSCDGGEFKYAVIWMFHIQEWQLVTSNDSRNKLFLDICSQCLH